VGRGALIPNWLKALVIGPSDREIGIALARGVLLGAIVFVVRFGNRVIKEGWSYAQGQLLNDAGLSLFIGGSIAIAIAAVGFFVRILAGSEKRND
jgi:hypothetical protein